MFLGRMQNNTLHFSAEFKTYLFGSDCNSYVRSKSKGGENCPQVPREKGKIWL